MANQYLLACIEQADREKGLRAVMAKSSVLHCHGQLWDKEKLWGSLESQCGKAPGCHAGVPMCCYWHDLLCRMFVWRQGLLLRRVCTQQQWEGGNCICFWSMSHGSLWHERGVNDRSKWCTILQLPGPRRPNSPVTTSCLSNSYLASRRADALFLPFLPLSPSFPPSRNRLQQACFCSQLLLQGSAFQSSCI